MPYAFTRLLAPAIALMRSLGRSTKLALMGVLRMAPLLLPALTQFRTLHAEAATAVSGRDAAVMASALPPKPTRASNDVKHMPGAANVLRQSQDPR